MGRDDTAAQRWSWPEWLLLAVLVAPFLVAAVAVLTGPYSDAGLVGDNALNQLRVADVGHHAVLTGPFSRGTWNHPGPFLYYALAVPYRLFGSRAVGMMIGALVINGAACAGTVVIARRLGGRLLMALVALALAVVLGSLGPVFLRDPWNPFVTVLPFGLVVLSAWALATGRWWHLPLVAVVGTFCMQSHIGYVPLVLALTAFALIAAVLSTRAARASEPPRPERSPLAPVLTALGALVVLWLPPVIDEVSGNGNLGRTRAYLMSGQATQGLGVALRVVGEAASATGGWVTGNHATSRLSGEPLTIHATPVPLVALAFLVVAALTWRRSDRTARLGIVTVAVADLAALVAVAQTTGPLYDYRLRFLWVLTAFTAAVTVWLVVRGRGVEPTAAWIALALAVVALVRPLAAATTPDPPDVKYVRRLEAIAPQVLAASPRGPGSVLVHPVDIPAAGYQAGLAAYLDAHGRHATFDDLPFYRLVAGNHRVQHGAPAATMTIAIGPGALTLAARPGSEPVAVWSSRTDGHGRRELRAVRRAADAARAGDPAARAELARLLAGPETVVVYRSPIPSPAGSAAP